MIKIEFPIDAYQYNLLTNSYTTLYSISETHTKEVFETQLPGIADLDGFFVLPSRSKLDNTQANRDLIRNELDRLNPKIICSSKLMDIISDLVVNPCSSVSVRLNRDYQNITLKIERSSDIAFTVPKDTKKERIVAEIMRELVFYGFSWDLDKKKFFKI